MINSYVIINKTNYHIAHTHIFPITKSRIKKTYSIPWNYSIEKDVFQEKIPYARMESTTYIICFWKNNSNRTYFVRNYFGTENKKNKKRKMNESQKLLISIQWDDLTVCRSQKPRIVFEKHTRNTKTVLIFLDGTGIIFWHGICPRVKGSSYNWITKKDTFSRKLYYLLTTSYSYND